MTFENENIETESVSPEDVNFDRQIARIRDILAGWEKISAKFNAPFDDEASRKKFMIEINLAPRKSGRSGIVSASECAVELGAPGSANVNAVLWTDDPSLVHRGEIALVGPDMARGKKMKAPFAQILLLSVKNVKDIDPYAMETTQYLANRLEGYMVRTVPGRLWARVSGKAVDKGFDFAKLGAALIAAYEEDFPYVAGAEVVFATKDDDAVESLASVAAESRILMGKNKKLSIVGDGQYECDDLDCDDCDEHETCDEVRDIIILRRKNKNDAGHHES